MVHLHMDRWMLCLGARRACRSSWCGSDTHWDISEPEGLPHLWEKSRAMGLLLESLVERWCRCSLGQRHSRWWCFHSHCTAAGKPCVAYVLPGFFLVRHHHTAQQTQRADHIPSMWMATAASGKC
uniref:Uncharacterized protein n=1 Tax=Alexandrium andersonii TaxID=327968 RepID=A0A7S2ABW6_9DINO|mmetsp:Transcript_10054/g.22889  ORF Transcript_10054/g.22889 Transcript_10054/m.22889 type:complete len:125 (+) Transcript_10054:160-534(+)